MRTVQIKISDTDYRKYNFGSEEMKFTDLVELISREYAKKALFECNEIATNAGLSEMTLDEINGEINAIRNAKNNS